MATQYQYKEVTVLWNGGWDTYIVDPGNVCDTPAKELVGNNMYFPSWYDGPNCGYPCWLKCDFIHEPWSQAGKSVKVIKHLNGGD